MDPDVPGTGVLLERNAELASVEELLAAAASGRGAVLLVQGPAGMGKTRLLESARAAAVGRGFRVLAARSSALEREFGFCVVHDLLTEVLRNPTELAGLMQGAARLAAAALDLDATAAPTFAVLHGIYWLVADLADRRPLLLIVDDAHWADVPSLRALHHLAHRIEGLPILLAIATRAAEPGSEAAGLLDALADEAETRVLRLGPLSYAATGVLLQNVLGTDLDDRFTTTCHEICGGNPLLVSALASSLASDGIRPDASAAEAVRTRAPTIVSAFVLPRLRRLPQPAATVARALAVLGGGTELRPLAGVAGLDVREVPGAIDQLVAADLVALEPRLDFVHPLFAQSVSDDMSVGQRRAAHRRAAQELAADGLPAQAVAAHLLHVPPLRDPWVVDRLRAAAQDALTQGALQPAVTYLRRALAEPPIPEVRPQLLFELGDAETSVDAPRGADRLAEALIGMTGATARAHTALRLARGLLAARELPRALEVLAAAVDEADAADVDPALARLLEAEYIGAGVSRPGTRVDALARLERLLPDAHPDTLAGCMLLATASVELLQVPARAAEAVDRATAALDGIVRLGVAFPPAVLYLAAPVLVAAGRISQAMAAAEAAVADARARGALAELSAALGSRAEGALRLGALLDAESDVRLADELGTQAGAPYQRRLTLTTLLPVLVAQGDADGAERELAGLQVGAGYAGLLIALGELRLAQGRPDEALSHVLAGGARLEQQRTWTHPGLFPWRTLAALAHHRAGRSAEARELADSALALARTYAAPIATGVALRTLGQLTGDLDALAEAARILSGTEARLEHAHALVELGAALRRANHRADAREPLNEGFQLATRLGATALRRRAADELAATGARPRRVRRTGVEALSASERRVARLAAEGLTNRDIAQALFVTTKTVEVHLSACYRKLGITSRRALAALLQ